MRSIIVAYDNNRAIGKENGLLWGRGEMKSDINRFKEMTTDATVIMGRKTLESIGRALPQRRNIVLTRGVLKMAGILTAPNLETAWELAGNEATFVIGGADIYHQALPFVDRVYATEVDAEIEGTDTYFDPLPEAEWKAVRTESHAADADNIYDYRFVKYDRL